MTRQRLVYDAKCRKVGFVTTDMLKPRKYQREAIDALRGALESGRYSDKEPKGPATVLPTGAGKTVVFANMAAEWLKDYPGTRVLSLAHRRELVSQAAEKFHSVAPHLSVGMVRGDENKAGRSVVCASVQTLTHHKTGLARREMIQDVSLVIVDECHHAPAEQYRTTMRHYAERGARFIGVTATMIRGDKLSLGEVWPEVVYTRSIAEMIRDRFLVRPIGIRVKVADLNLSKVKKSGGDYNAHDLGEALTDSLAPAAIARAYREHAADRSGILFAPTVAVAEMCQEAMINEGFTCSIVYDGMARKDRDQALADFSAGRVQVLANCMILTEGTDLPIASAVVIVRPTTSVGLFVQMVGRGLRLYPGKSNAVVLDVTGVGLRHKLISPIELYAEESGMKIIDEEAHLNEDGDLVLDLFDDEPEQGSGREEYSGRDGVLDSKTFDLFEESESAWQRTNGGTWFIPAGERLIAIVKGKQPMTYSVVAMPKTPPGGRWVIEDVADLGAAMAWAEQNVTPYEQMLVSKGKRWRKDEPSDAQKNWCLRSGIPWEGMTKGEISSLMSLAVASRRIDPVVARVYGGAA